MVFGLTVSKLREKMQSIGLYAIFIFTVFISLSNIIFENFGYTTRLFFLLVFFVAFLNLSFKRFSFVENFFVYRFLFLYSVFLAYVLFTSIIYEEYSLVTPYLSFVVFFVALYFIISIILRLHSLYDVMLVFTIVFLIHSFFVLYGFFDIGFKSWVEDNIAFEGNIDFMSSFRSRGILSAEGATVSVFLSFGTLSSVFLFIKSKTYIIKVFSLISLFVIFLAIFVSGRTGFVLILFFLMPVLVAALLKSLFKRKLDFDFIRFIFLASLLGIAVVLIFLQIYDFYSKNTGMKTSWGDDLLESVISWVFQEGSGTDSTMLVLLRDHVHFNPSLKGLLFGDPYFLSDGISSDIGYIRILSNFGICGLFLYYFSMFYFFISVALRVACRLSRLLLLFLTLALFVIEFKEPFLYKLIIVSCYMFVFLTFYLDDSRKRKLQKEILG